KAISTNGTGNAAIKNVHLIRRSVCGVLPWKNSRRLKAPAVKPRDFCTTFAARMPVALCTVDFGRSRALRLSDATRGRPPPSVSAHALNPNPGTNARADHTALALA